MLTQMGRMGVTLLLSCVTEGGGTLAIRSATYQPSFASACPAVNAMERLVEACNYQPVCAVLLTTSRELGRGPPEWACAHGPWPRSMDPCSTCDPIAIPNAKGTAASLHRVTHAPTHTHWLAAPDLLTPPSDAWVTIWDSDPCEGWEKEATVSYTCAPAATVLLAPTFSALPCSLLAASHYACLASR